MRRCRRPEDIPHVLSREALDKALAEARWLRHCQQVEVRDLQPGEEAGPPRPAEDVTVPGAKPLP